MSVGAPHTFFRAAVLYALLGVATAVYIAISQDSNQQETHAHLLLVGWMTVFLYGAFLKFYPSAGGVLATVLWWIANVGTVLAALGFFVLNSGTPDAGGALLAIGSILVLAGVVLFTFMVWRLRE